MRIRSAMVVSTRSPLAWPRKSFITLKRSRSKKRIAVSRLAARRTSSSRSRERRLGRPVRSSCRAMYSVRSSASMRACSCTSMEAIACRALISSGVQACRPKWRNPRTPQVVSDRRRGTQAPPTRCTPEPFSTRSRYSSGFTVDAGQVGLAEVLGGGKDRIGVERHLAERVGTSGRHAAATRPRGCSSHVGGRCDAGTRRRRPRNSASTRVVQVRTSWRRPRRRPT